MRLLKNKVYIVQENIALSNKNFCYFIKPTSRYEWLETDYVWSNYFYEDLWSEYSLIEQTVSQFFTDDSWIIRPANKLLTILYGLSSNG